MVTSDGPAGVRGTVQDEGHPSASLPCPSALVSFDGVQATQWYSDVASGNFQAVLR